MGERVKFNIGGSRHETAKSTLMAYPETLLARMLCDSNSVWAKKDADDSYFFDRNPTLFPFVLDFYRTGKIVFPKIVSKDDFIEELKFWCIEISIEEKMPAARDIIDYNAVPATHSLIEKYKDVILRNADDFLIEINSMMANVEDAIKKSKREAYGVCCLAYKDEFLRCFHFKHVELVYSQKGVSGNSGQRIYYRVIFPGYDRECIGGANSYNCTHKNFVGIKVTF